MAILRQFLCFRLIFGRFSVSKNKVTATRRSAHMMRGKENIMTQNARITALEENMATMSTKLDQLIALMSAQQAQPKGTKKSTTCKNAPKEPKELVDFVKADGTTRKCTRKQAEAWTKWRDGSDDRKEAFESMKAGWADKKAAYKPSKELVDAIKANRAAITRKVAKEEYGFIGSKEDLKALKDSICK